MAGTGDEWYTPPMYVEAVRAVLGGIDLDPASCYDAQRVVKAAAYYTQEQNGITLPWSGRIFLNPPYSNPAPFTGKFLVDYRRGLMSAGVVLVGNYTDTAWFQELLMVCPVCFLRGRIGFWNMVDGYGEDRSRHGSAFFYLGPDRGKFREVFSRFGVVMEESYGSTNP